MTTRLCVLSVFCALFSLCSMSAAPVAAEFQNDYAAARAAYQEGDLELAIKKAKKMITHDPEHTPSRLLLVEIYETTGNDEQLVKVAEGFPIGFLMKDVATRKAVLAALRRLGRERDVAELQLKLADQVIALARYASDAERKQRFQALGNWLDAMDSSMLSDERRGRFDALTLEALWELGNVEAALGIVSGVSVEDVEPPLLFLTMRSLLEKGRDSAASDFFQRYLRSHGAGDAANLRKCAGGDEGWERKLFGLDEPESADPLLAGVDNVSNPILIESSKVDPQYPELARVARVDGQVVLQAIVKEDGVVGDISVIRVNRPNLGFEDSAIDAVRRWLYMPALADCTPVDVYFTVVIDFSLH